MTSALMDPGSTRLLSNTLRGSTDLSPSLSGPASRVRFLGRPTEGYHYLDTPYKIAVLSLGDPLYRLCRGRRR